MSQIIVTIRKTVFALAKFFRLWLKYKKHRWELGFTPTIKDTDDTLDYLLREKCSISRFGDGEFLFIKNATPKELAPKLIRALTRPIDNHVVGIPRALVDQSNLSLDVRFFWLEHFCKISGLLSILLKPDVTYYDASLTRFYIPYRTKGHCPRYLAKIKRLWEGQDILIIEGRFSRIGANNHLLDNAGSILRVLCPEKCAYEEYDDILQAGLQFGRDRLILLALGQTATALAYDFANKGYWAIDIGHVDIEYEWYLSGAKSVEGVTGKHVNEAGYIPSNNDKFDDSVYLSQVVAHIGLPEVERPCN